MSSFLSFFRNVVVAINRVKSRYKLGGGAVLAGFIAAVFVTLGVEMDQAVGISVAIVSTALMVFALFGLGEKGEQSDKTDKTDEKGKVRYVLVSKDIDGYRSKQATGKGQVVWYTVDMSHEVAKDAGWLLGVDADGNVYDIMAGMIIGERHAGRSV